MSHYMVWIIRLSFSSFMVTFSSYRPGTLMVFLDRMHRQASHSFHQRHTCLHRTVRHSDFVVGFQTPLNKFKHKYVKRKRYTSPLGYLVSCWGYTPSRILNGVSAGHCFIVLDRISQLSFLLNGEVLHPV